MGNLKKLVLHFFHKEKYVLHYKNLQLWSMFGLKIKKVCCGLEFNQSKWLRPCIEFKTHTKM